MELLEVDVPVVILVRQTDQGLGLTLRHHPAQLLDQLDQLLRGDQSVLVVVKQTEGLSERGQRVQRRTMCGTSLRSLSPRRFVVEVILFGADRGGSI